MTAFSKILINTLIATFTTNFLWFALTFWVYLGTRSVIAASVVGACYPLFSSLFGILFGTYVDNHKKKSALLLSGNISTLAFILAGLVYLAADNILSLSNPLLWIFIVLVMIGAVAVNLRLITLSTLVTILIPLEKHDKANGQVGIVNGLSFALTSVFSGLAIAYIGMGWSMIIGIVMMLVTTIHLIPISFRDKVYTDSDVPLKKFDLEGSIQAIKEIPGLPALIFFTMINNFLAGVFFALMDPYGLELVSVQAWGFIWGALSFSFMFGGMIVASRGLGKSPLKRLFQANALIWVVGILFPLQPSVIFLVIGMFLYMQVFPVVEAAEQTVLQKIVPLKKQGRVFGLAQTAESLATPITALAAGPITEIYFIPLMSEGGAGSELVGSWFGVGVNRGIAVCFIFASIIGLAITLLAFSSAAYKRLSLQYAK